MAKRQAKLKKVAYRFIPPESEHGQPMYALLRELVGAYHTELRNARIALAWNLAWQPDVDGRMKLGMCRKASDLDREIGGCEPFDFVIILRREFWQDTHVTDRQRRALLDHELCHATIKLDEHGEPAVDERGRLVYRTRKHDLEEFVEIGERYGCWKKDITEFARAVERAKHKVKGRFIAYTSLFEQLLRASVPIPIEIVATWSDAERRETAYLLTPNTQRRSRTWNRKQSRWKFRRSMCGHSSSRSLATRP
jgi:hypothetical protein